MNDPLARRAAELLTELAGPGVGFRSGQLEGIRALVESASRLLLVQRTGWGKSAVYFITTRLLRERGAGPTLLISPLLALMRNQIDMAKRVGVRAATINSANEREWPAIQHELDGDRVDLLLISPERLNNADFRRKVMPALASRSGLIVIDEVHCISDWGHDFRPDYRRIGKLLELLPSNVPILGTTATANDRVITDICDQLGEDLIVSRGTLERDSLKLYASRLPDQAARMAWLATYIPKLPGSGIVYCLTVADTRRVADWLRDGGIDAVEYSGDEDPQAREQIEARLLDNKVKAVVATSALGMGFDKPDLAFVIHFQAPGSAIAYYQQVGRAGRAVDIAYGMLLAGEEDVDIQDYFIRTAFPPRDQAEAVIALLADAAGPLRQEDLEAKVNVRRSRLLAMLKILEVEGAVEKTPTGWLRTLRPWTYDQARVDRVTAQRRAEQRAMRDYLATEGCLMAFLRAQLDDPQLNPCGRCSRCTGKPLPMDVDQALVVRAVDALRSQSRIIEARKRWPAGLNEVSRPIPRTVRAEQGRALSVFGDAGWGGLVRQGKFVDEHFANDLVVAAADLVSVRWLPDPRPTWVTCVPSLRRPTLVHDFAERLAARLQIPFKPIIIKTRATNSQKEMENSAQQAANVRDAFELIRPPSADAVLLVDDIVDSRWTMTVVTALLRQAGSGPVFPFVLATAQPR